MRALIGVFLILAVVFTAWFAATQVNDAPDSHTADQDRAVPVLRPLHEALEEESERSSSGPTSAIVDIAPVTGEVEPAAPSAPTQSPDTDLPVGRSGGEVTGEPIETDAPATARDETQSRDFDRYIVAAEAFIEAYARPSEGTSSEQWWSEVEPLLTPSAREDYSWVDPAVVPFTQITAESVVVPTDAPDRVLRVVRVFTDAGPYLVSMQTDETGIKVIRISPEGES